MNPVYTERRNTTYAISETDLMGIAAFTAESSRLYSIGGFLFGALANILVSYGGAASALSPVADFMLHRISWILVGAAFFFFAWGYTVTLSKDRIIDQIRRECGIEPDKRLVRIFYEFLKRRLQRDSESR